MFARPSRPGSHPTRTRVAWLRAVPFVLLLAAAACRGQRPPAAGPLTVTPVTGATAGETLVRLTGLSAGELQALRGWSDPERWQHFVRLDVAGNDLAPVAGRYVVTDDAVEFHPAFPLEAGRAYVARVDPGQLPTPRSGPAITTTVALAADPRAPATSVVAVFPSADVWPENMLRFYVHFSAPMSRGQGTRFVHLQDAEGKEIADAILAAYADLWNPEQTRLTVFFDPGRVKRGVGPNVALGRAIVAGRSYRIVVDREWPDAHGQPLAAGFTRTFTAGAPAYRALSTRDWRVAPPRAGSRDDLAVMFPGPLDRALLERAIGVRTADGRSVPGTVTVSPGDARWQFVPATPWAAGAFELVALSLLEDPAGNRIGRAFEVLESDPQALRPDPDTVSLPFTVR